MEKLGFAINIASRGAHPVFTYNEGRWTNQVVDIRDYLKLFNGLDGIGNALPFLSFDEDGCFVTLLKSISGRDNDFVAGWIYIPRTISISGRQIAEKVRFVQEIISQSNIEAFKDTITSVFSEEYDKRISSSYIPSVGDRYGFRKLGFYTLEEILDKRYQDEYQGFKAIFLVEKESISNEYVPKFVDFTNHKLKMFYVLVNPTQEDVKTRFGQDVTLWYVEEKQYKLFDKPIRVKEGDIIDIALRRDRFEPFLTKYQPRQDNEVCDVSKICHPEWKYLVSRSSIKILDENNEQLHSIQISINSRKLDRDLLLDEAECRRAKISISASGYEKKEEYINLLSSSLQFRLERETEKYSNKIQLASGDVGEFTLRGKAISDLGSNLLEGYSKDDRGVLSLDSLYILKQRLLGFGFAAALACVILCYIGVKNWWNTHDFHRKRPFITKIEEQDDNTCTGQTYVIQSIPKVQSSGSDNQCADSLALGYLNSHEKWSKSELDKYSITKGLFEELNEYKFEELIKRSIDGCSHFQEIKEISNKAKNHSIKLDSNYNNPDDYEITINNWINTIDKKIASKTSTSQPSPKCIQAPNADL